MKIGFYFPPAYSLNNFSPHAVEFEGKLYPTSEHAYQAAKCLYPKAKDKIRLAKSAMESKTMANKVFAEFRDTDWDSKKVSVMERVIRAKLEQHEEVRQTLLETGTNQIVEDSPDDYFWGEGADGSGQNQLGKLWIKIRDELTSNL